MLAATFEKLPISESKFVNVCYCQLSVFYLVSI